LTWFYFEIQTNKNIIKKNAHLKLEINFKVKVYFFKVISLDQPMSTFSNDIDSPVFVWINIKKSFQKILDNCHFLSKALEILLSI